MSTDYAGVSSLPTTIPIPDDGDDEDSSSVAPALEGLKDSIVNLNARLSVLEVDVLQLVNVVLTAIDIQPADIDTFTTTSYVDATSSILTVPGCHVGDLIQLDVTGTAYTNKSSAASYAQLRIAGVDDFGGTNVLFGPTGAMVEFANDDLTGSVRNPFSFTVHHTVATAGACQFKIQGRTRGTTPANSISINSCLIMRAYQFRKAL